MGENNQTSEGIFEKIERIVKELVKGAIVLVAIAALFLGVSVLYGMVSPEKRAEAKKEKEEMLEAEYRRGYEAGRNAQEYDDSDKWLVDGVSLRDIYDRVWDEYGMTPNEAYSTVEDYTSEPDNGDISWEDYQIALEVVLRIASLMPYQ